MNDFLRHLAAQALDVPHGMQLRVPGLFEPSEAEPTLEDETFEARAVPDVERTPDRETPDVQRRVMPDMPTLTARVEIQPVEGAAVPALDPEPPPPAAAMFLASQNTTTVTTLCEKPAQPWPVTEPPRSLSAEAERATPAAISSSSTRPVLQPTAALPSLARASTFEPFSTIVPAVSRTQARAPAADQPGRPLSSPRSNAAPAMRVALPWTAEHAPAAPEQTVSISIGRIEVRLPPSAASKETRPRATPVMTLDAYMRRRQSRKS